MYPSCQVIFNYDMVLPATPPLFLLTNKFVIFKTLPLWFPQGGVEPAVNRH